MPHTLTRGTFGTELPRGGVSLRRGPDGLRRRVDRRFALARRGSPNFSCRGFLLRDLAALILHLAAVEAHAAITLAIANLHHHGTFLG